MTSLLIVDDNVLLITALGKMLAPVGRVSFATAGRAALEQMRDQPPDIVLLDAEMPDMTGYAVCQAMRADPELQAIPVIFVTSHNDAEAEVRGLAAGAVDFISKPVNEAVLLARVRTQLRLKALADELRRSALTDGLTGLANRSSFDQRLQLEWARAVRTGSELALLLLDVDHFKKYNDCYGHPAGDACLRGVALSLGAQARRPADLAARVGGEEFALLLPDADEAGAVEAAERVRAAVAALEVPHAASPTADHVTVSIGVISCRPVVCQRLHDREGLVRRADEALYAAKAQGRDRACTLPTKHGSGELGGVQLLAPQH